MYKGDVLIKRGSGQRFTLSRDELLTLPEFVLLSLFPNGLLPDGHLNNYHEGDAFQVDVRPSISIPRASRPMLTPVTV